MKGDEQLPDATENECERCGAFAEGRFKTMFYNWGTIARLRGLPVAREFYCHRCLRVMRIYSVIGFSLLALFVVGIVGGTVWVLYGP